MIAVLDQFATAFGQGSRAASGQDFPIRWVLTLTVGGVNLGAIPESQTKKRANAEWGDRIGKGIHGKLKELPMGMDAGAGAAWGPDLMEVLTQEEDWAEKKTGWLDATHPSARGLAKDTEVALDPFQRAWFLTIKLIDGWTVYEADSRGRTVESYASFCAAALGQALRARPLARYSAQRPRAIDCDLH